MDRQIRLMPLGSLLSASPGWFALLLGPTRIPSAEYTQVRIPSKYHVGGEEVSIDEPVGSAPSWGLTPALTGTAPVA
jgi:hypothetical protein